MENQRIDQSVQIKAESWSCVRHDSYEDETMMLILGKHGCPKKCGGNH